MKFFRFLSILSILTFFGMSTQAQVKELKVFVQDESNESLKNIQVEFPNVGIIKKTDSRGLVTLIMRNKTEVQLYIFEDGYKQYFNTILLTENEQSVKVVLEKWVETLDEVKVESQKSKTFGLTRLNAVQNFAINEGKKTEVINLEEMTINSATNNPRQIFSKIAGLNIWESDGAGLQLGIGGRGLNPNRTSNFNTRQNGYDISADALGYPESYYTPPTEAIQQIQVIRGAASLQYGTQFGGLLNFQFKEGTKERRVEVRQQASIGSWGFLGNFTSLSGSSESGKVHYYGFYNYKQGDGFRDNSGFNAHYAYGSIHFQPTSQFEFSIELTKMNYLAQQAGGLTDTWFQEDATRSERARNWFQVDWNLAALMSTYKFSELTQINTKTFGLYAERMSLGNLERINVFDRGENRTLIDGKFRNVGHETRFVHRYEFNSRYNILAAGFRLYRGHTFARQGDGSDGSDADFRYLNPNDLENSDYRFPNYNYAFFAEHIFQINDALSITPGFRIEHIRTYADGYYKQIVKDGAGNIIVDNRIDENQKRVRYFFLGGLGISYKPKNNLEIYANFSQNYRAINFTDLRIVNPNFVIDPNIQDEEGYTVDLGFRGRYSNWLSYEMTTFFISYEGKIGQILRSDQPPLFNDYRFRGNISDARNIGAELFAEISFSQLLDRQNSFDWKAFVNTSFIDARYINTDDSSIRNKQVEMVPPFTIRLGTSTIWKQFSFDIQWAYTHEHFSDATNAIRTASAVEGIIPSYSVMDISLSYNYGRYTLKSSINNALDARYFTRRAEAYPGPGIIPADGRGFYTTLEITI